MSKCVRVVALAQAMQNLQTPQDSFHSSSGEHSSLYGMGSGGLLSLHPVHVPHTRSHSSSFSGMQLVRMEDFAEELARQRMHS